MDRQTDVHTDRQKDRQQTDRRTDRKTHRQTDGRTHRHTCICISAGDSSGSYPSRLWVEGERGEVGGDPGLERPPPPPPGPWAANRLERRFSCKALAPIQPCDMPLMWRSCLYGVRPSTNKNPSLGISPIFGDLISVKSTRWFQLSGSELLHHSVLYN